MNRKYRASKLAHVSLWGQRSDAATLAEAHRRIAELEAIALPCTQDEFLLNVIDSLPHPFYVVDAKDYRILLANHAARLGILSGEVTCYALTHRRDQPCGTAEHPCPLEEVKRTGEPVVVEHMHYDKDGHARLMEVHAYPLLDDHGEVIQMIECALDITERKQAEQEREKLIGALQDTLAHVKRLRGLLPICASCKRIRADEGYWQEVDVYIHEHSEAEFSHGICPDCARKLYPGIYGDPQ